MTGTGSFVSARYDTNGNQMNDPALDNVTGSGGGTGFTYMAEVPTGLQDGSNKVFTLAHIPTADADIIFNYNGLMLTVAGGDFTRVGAVCTFAIVSPTDVAHSGTDVFLANYS